MSKKDKYQKVAYYPGCALEGTGHSYNRSTKAVGKALGLDLDFVRQQFPVFATQNGQEVAFFAPDRQKRH